MLKRTVLVVALVVAGTVTAGCGAGQPTAVAPSASSAPTSAAPSPTPAAPLTVDRVLAGLRKAGLPLSKATVQNEDNDPNNLLGRPNGYTARGSAELPGGDKSSQAGGIDRGLVVEVWPTPQAARDRSTYIQSQLKNRTYLGTEYHYFRDGVLLRVTGKVKPSQAKRYEAAFKAL